MKVPRLIKTVKFQKLTSSFEKIRMEEDETFDEFYNKLKDIVNFAFKLGESIVESKIIRKIFRPLLERFHAKITAIEEVKDIDQIPLTELVGKLQTYEMRLGLMGKCGNNSSEDEDESEDEYEDDDKDEDLTFILMGLSGFFNIGKRIRTNLLGHLNPLRRVKVKNPLSSAMNVKVMVI